MKNKIKKDSEKSFLDSDWVVKNFSKQISQAI